MSISILCECIFGCLNEWCFPPESEPIREYSHQHKPPVSDFPPSPTTPLAGGTPPFSYCATLLNGQVCQADADRRAQIEKSFQEGEVDSDGDEILSCVHITDRG